MTTSKSIRSISAILPVLAASGRTIACWMLDAASVLMASRAHTGVLDHEGSYAGFDIVRVGITWAQKNIASRFPNFSFVHADIFNKHYNPKGKTVFELCFVFLITMVQLDLLFLKSATCYIYCPARYRTILQEIRRVMKPSGVAPGGADYS